MMHYAVIGLWGTTNCQLQQESPVMGISKVQEYETVIQHLLERAPALAVGMDTLNLNPADLAKVLNMPTNVITH
eukprot:gene7589-17163_t